MIFRPFPRSPYSLITHTLASPPRGMGYEGVDCTPFLPHSSNFSSPASLNHIRILSPFTGTGPDGRSKGFRHIEFESLDDAVAAIESELEEPFHLAGRDLCVDYGAEHAGAPINKLYFSGFVGEEQGLRALFGEFAPEIRSIFFCASSLFGAVVLIM